MRIYTGDVVTIKNFDNCQFTVIRRELHSDGLPIFDVINISTDVDCNLPIITEIYGIKEDALIPLSSDSDVVANIIH